MMWAPLLLAGFLSGWWGALALAAAPPAIRDTLGKTSGVTSIIEARHYRPLSESAVDEAVPPVYQPEEIQRHPELSSSEEIFARREDLDEVDLSSLNDRENYYSQTEKHSSENDARQISRQFPGSSEESLPEANLETRKITPSLTQPEDSARDIFSAGEAERDVRVFLPEINESGLTRALHHSSTQAPLTYSAAMVPTTLAESSMERPRVVRSAKQRPKNRTRADSPREQRRRCKNKERGCRGQNWCPDLDVGNRAFLAPTVFEGKARSMSLRKPGSNYAVTFEVKQVYKSQPGFQPLQKNDNVRLHFRDKSTSGKSTVCNNYGSYDAGSKGDNQQQQRDNPSGVVRANIRRGRVYLVFVNRVGPRNFTILGEPVIRTKKNEQAVQAVVRPDYGESQKLCATRFFSD